MKTLNICFSVDDGVLRTDDQILVLPGLKRLEFHHGLGQHMNSGKSAPGYVVYGPISAVMWEQGFAVGLRFFKDVIQGVTLSLEKDGVVTLGYEATEKDLLTEKKTLTAMISEHLECSPSSTSLGADVFEFPWGGIVSRADQKSTWCGIEIWYKY